MTFLSVKAASARTKSERSYSDIFKGHCPVLSSMPMLMFLLGDQKQINKGHTT